MIGEYTGNIMNHSYEEIRGVVLDLLSGREKRGGSLNAYIHLELGVAEVFRRREGNQQPIRPREQNLSSQDSELIRDVFWDLFRQGLIILGCNSLSCGSHWHESCC